jgi:hypothetical protein
MHKEYIQRLIDSAPPLPTRERDELRELLPMHNDIEITITRDEDGSRTLNYSYPVGDYETGSAHFRYSDAPPPDLLRQTRILESPDGRRYATGTVIEHGNGIGVAWPV